MSRLRAAGAIVGSFIRRLRRHHIDNEAVAALDQQVAQVRQPRLGPLDFRYNLASGSVVEAEDVSIARAQLKLNQQTRAGELRAVLRSVVSCNIR